MFLMKEFLNSNSQYRSIHILCYDTHYEKLKKMLNFDSDTIQFHDCSLNIQDEICKLENILLNLHESEGYSFKVLLIFDSLTSLILERDFQSVYRLLNQLVHRTSNFKLGYLKIQMLAILHEEMILNYDETIKHMRHLSKAWITVGKDTIDVEIKRSNGKWKSNSHGYEITETGSVLRKERMAAVDSKPKSEPVVPMMMRLAITEEEKRDREAIKLPFLKHIYNCEEDSNKIGGEIHYEPDENDDWDDEDPDEF